ncbi:MAG TPA: MFS transporter [Solirubrobacteraceae bacterium]
MREDTLVSAPAAGETATSLASGARSDAVATPLISERRADAPAGLSWQALSVLLLGFSLSVTDFFIVNVALPTMGRDLHASDASLELVVSGYGLSYALLLVLGGRLGDGLGRRRLFTIGIGLFTICSLFCGLAPNVLTLIVARVLQGASAALMVPQVLATFHASLDEQRRARAIGLYGATAGLSMIVGQALGGLLVSADIAGSGWRAIFLVNVPIGIAGLALLRRVPETRSDRPSPIDRPGTVLLTATLLCLLLPLTEGHALGWPWWSWVLLGLVPLGGYAFARKELSLEARGVMPLVPPSIVRVRSVRRGICIALPFFMSFGGFMFVYAIVSQDGLHLKPLTAGLALIPYALAFFGASLQTARLVNRFGNRVMAVGAVMQGFAYGGMALALLAERQHPSWLVFGALFVLTGSGQALLVSPMFRLLLSEVPGHLAGAGTGMLTTLQQSSLAIGVAVLGTLDLELVPKLGIAGGTAVVLGVQSLVAFSVALGAVRLIDRR